MEQLDPARAPAKIGPEPPRDPGYLRELAAELRLAAHQLDTGAESRLDSWDLPAAKRANSTVEGAAAWASDAVRKAAVLFERDADELAAELERWR